MADTAQPTMAEYHQTEHPAGKKCKGCKAPNPQNIRATFTKLRGLYSQRNAEFTRLRQAFGGTFVSTSVTNALGLGETNDRKRIAYNLVNFSIRRFMDELSSPHRVEAIPRGMKQGDIAFAERRQKLLNRIKIAEQIDLKVVMAAYHQGLLDKAIWNVRPDPSAELKVRIELITPEYYYPIPKSSNWIDKKACMVSWIPFDMESPDSDPMGQNIDQSVEMTRVIEYWDACWYVRIEGDQVKFAAAHCTGEVLTEEAHNIPIPDQHRGQGDADRVLGLNEALNESLSDQADTLSYLANPIIVVRGSKSGTGGLVFGPRAIWELERDGAAEILTWAGSPPSFDAHILRLMQGIEDGTGLSSPAFGREIPSGVSGEAVRSILAGFNTRVGTKQQLMALCLAGVYRKAQKVLESQFPNEEFAIPDEVPVISPKEFEGHYDVQVVFEPQNETVKVFAELQKMQAGVQSKLTTMKHLGIVNPEDEYRRIITEKMLDAELAFRQQGAQGGQPWQPMGQGMPQGQPMQPVNGSMVPELAKRLTSSDPGRLEDISGIRDAGSHEVKVQDVMDHLEGVDFSGSVKAEGDLATEGRTSGRLRLRVADASDVGRVRQALGPLASRADIVLGDQEPVMGDTINVGRPPSGKKRRYGG